MWCPDDVRSLFKRCFENYSTKTLWHSLFYLFLTITYLTLQFPCDSQSRLPFSKIGWLEPWRGTQAKERKESEWGRARQPEAGWMSVRMGRGGLKLRTHCKHNSEKRNDFQYSVFEKSSRIRSTKLTKYNFQLPVSENGGSCLLESEVIE